MILAYSPLIILLGPLLAGAFIGLFGDRLGEKAYRIAVVADVLGFVLSLHLLYLAASQNAQDVAFSPSLVLYGLDSGLRIDRLAAVMMAHITGISALIHIFSSRYMQQERGYARFHSLLAFTTFALLGMVASAGLLMLFLFWQLLSWLLSFLSYNYAHPPTVRGSFRTFIMQRFGDVAFLLGIVLANDVYGTLNMQELFRRAGQVHAIYSPVPGWGWQLDAATVITLLIFVGAMSKSAQIPLHMWLPDSLYAPTPVHALLHAGIINAGGFLLARLAPLYEQSPATLHVIFAVGLMTALLGSSMMLIQNDIKKTLGYSTIGQMGFMIMECGLGAFALAIFHLIAHGIFKGTIFLNCGNVIHAARQEPRLPPRQETAGGSAFSSLTWMTGFVTTLILPLVILLAGHGVLQIPLRDSQGAVIFLFFGWVTSSQAILTLYRLRAVASWKVAAAMLFTLFLVIVTYLLAAERFTYFLFPGPGEAARHFAAGALPGAVFDVLVAAAALLIVLSWALIYANAHGQRIRLPSWVHALQVHVYLVLMNRLYLDALALGLGQHIKRLIDVLHGSRSFSFLAAVIALMVAWEAGGWPAGFSHSTAIRLLFGALLLPLFPLHGLYVAALTRPRASIAAAWAVLLPLAGLLGTIDILRAIPDELSSAVRTLSLFGALYGTLKALAQSRVMPLLAYASLCFYSVLWWHVTGTRVFSPQAAVYFTAAAVITSALLLAWSRLQARYGEWAPDRIGGLARPMPQFALLVALLVMAAVGLPPFGLFAGYSGMLLGAPFSWDTAIILLAWLAASFYFFRMMQRLLFGPQRADLPYEDLRAAEAAPLLLMLAILVGVGLLPHEFFGSGPLASAARTAMEIAKLWIQ